MHFPSLCFIDINVWVTGLEFFDQSVAQLLLHNIFYHIIIMFSVIVLLQRTNYVVGRVHIIMHSY